MKIVLSMQSYVSHFIVFLTNEFFFLLSFQIYCDPPKYTKNSIYTPIRIFFWLNMTKKLKYYLTHLSTVVWKMKNISKLSGGYQRGRFENGVMNEKFEEFCGDQYIPKLKI